MNRRGNITIIVSIAALVVALSVFLYYGRASNFARKHRLKGHLDVEAQLLALELSEFFTTMNQAKLQVYFAELPYTLPPTSLPAYPLCAHINIKDFGSGVRVNPDDAAELPKGALGGRPARRYYKVDIVDKLNLTPNDSCTGLMKNYVLSSSDNEGFFVTIYVDYIDENGNVRVTSASVLINET